MAPGDLLTVPGAHKNAEPLNSAQKKFNKLLQQLRAQRQELVQWVEYRQNYNQRLASEYQPLVVRLREKRVAMVRLLDRVLDGSAFGRRERDQLREMLTGMLAELLAEAKDAELEGLFEKHADRSFDAEQRHHLKLLRALASEELGIDVDDYVGGDTPEELAAWLKDQAGTARPAGRAKAGATNHGRPKSDREKSDDAPQARAAEGAMRAVRVVFRKLASALHPDREPDAAARAAKTELMKRVNQAYQSGDLLALLELQLSIEQIDQEALGRLAREQLRDYVRVLERQSRRLREELSEVLAPFVAALGGTAPRGFNPKIVNRALDADIRALKETIRGLDADLLRFRDSRQLIASLSEFRIDDLDDDEWSVAEALPVLSRRRRRR